MENILYMCAGAPYLNITNACPCRCVFCLRDYVDSVEGAVPLWLDHAPDFPQVQAAIDSVNLDMYNEITFCGFGEPTCALELLIETAKYIKGKSGIKIRLNTNGLSDLINKKDTAPLLTGLIDTVSVSLNAPDAEMYDRLTRPSFGPASFDVMLSFSEQCKALGMNVVFTVVDCLAPAEIERCRALAGELGIPLRIRAQMV